MIISSKDTWIVCPKSHAKRQIHACVIDKCKYESGHTISHDGSYVDCMFGETKQLTFGGDEK
jgi:hypothetical protein